jgi:hypothetical protein
VRCRCTCGVRTGSVLKPQETTFPGFLNILDGLFEPNDLIVAMTTNRIAKFDSAFLRPGRVDLMINLHDLSAPCTRDMLDFQFYPEKLSEEPYQKLAAVSLDLRRASWRGFVSCHTVLRSRLIALFNTRKQRRPKATHKNMFTFAGKRLRLSSRVLTHKSQLAACLLPQRKQTMSTSTAPCHISQFSVTVRDPKHLCVTVSVSNNGVICSCDEFVYRTHPLTCKHIDLVVTQMGQAQCGDNTSEQLLLGDNRLRSEPAAAPVLSPDQLAQQYANYAAAGKRKGRRRAIADLW